MILPLSSKLRSKNLTGPQMLATGLIGMIVVGSGLQLYLQKNSPANGPTRELNIQQQWTMQAGREVAGYQVVSGLGDVAFNLEGGAVYAPADGKIEQTPEGFVLFSSGEMPGYIIRFGGLEGYRLGEIQQGDKIGTADKVAISVLTRDPEGSGEWVIVAGSEALFSAVLTSPQ